jgi:hypothetical protein
VRILTFLNIPLYPLRLQQTKGFPNAILNPSRKFARLFRGEEFFAAWRAPIRLRILDYHRDLVVARRKLLANSLHAVRTTNCAGNFHKWHTLVLSLCYFRECLPAFSLTLGFCRFACARTMSAFGFPYFVILIRSPCTARSTNSSNLLFASVNPTVSMTACACNSGAMLGWTATSNALRRRLELQSLPCLLTPTASF